MDGIVVASRLGVAAARSARYVPPVRPRRMARSGMGLFGFFFTWVFGLYVAALARAGKRRSA
jgi:hypothetical protein